METARDIAIIVLVIINIIWLLILSAIGAIALMLFLKVKGQIPEILETASATATTVKGTTEFVSETALTPLIRIVAFFAAVAKFFQVLLGGERRRAQ